MTCRPELDGWTTFEALLYRGCQTTLRNLRRDPRAMAMPCEAPRPVGLRNRWLNPPEWVERVDEPVPGAPKRQVPRDEDAAKALQKPTLTNHLQRRPQWRADVHEGLDAATAAAYGWWVDISNDGIPCELLALNRGGRRGAVMRRDP